LLQLGKPRVTVLIVFTAIIGMWLAADGQLQLPLFFAASAGIALMTMSAAAINHLVERHIDARMSRTRARPLPSGQVTGWQAVAFAAGTAAIGLLILYLLVNPLTMWLTAATAIGYSVIYTIFLKPSTPQNIVIGGAAGAMPPVLGWAAVSNSIAPEALILFMIIFAWTPPHFWALALYRVEDYARSGLPMLPVTHGREFTCLHVLLYTIILSAASLAPFAVGMSGWLYLTAALLLDAGFVYRAVGLYRNYSDARARATFRYSIVYLTALFAALLVDNALLRIL
jgi:protoheme IX farnesyltransferase